MKSIEGKSACHEQSDGGVTMAEGKARKTGRQN